MGIIIGVRLTFTVVLSPSSTLIEYFKSKKAPLGAFLHVLIDAAIN